MGCGLRVAGARGLLAVLGCEFVIWVAGCGWGARGSLAMLGCEFMIWVAGGRGSLAVLGFEFVIWVAGGRGSLAVLCGAGLWVAVSIFGLA